MARKVSVLPTTSSLLPAVLLEAYLAVTYRETLMQSNFMPRYSRAWA